MRGGRSIWTIAGGVFAAWLLQPLWQWAFGKFLDSASRLPGGFVQEAGRVVATIAPVQPFLLGVSIGMILAFTIGYWDQVKERARYWFEWGRALQWLFWECRPGLRRVSHCISVLRSTENYKEHRTSAPVHPDTARLEWQPRDKVYLRQTDSRTVTIMRMHVQGVVPTDISVIYEVWGHRDFWATIKTWHETKSIEMHLSYKRMMQEAKKNDALPSQELPEFEP